MRKHAYRCRANPTWRDANGALGPCTCGAAGAALRDRLAVVVVVVCLLAIVAFAAWLGVS